MAVREDSIRRSDGSVDVYGVVDAGDIALVIPLDGDRLQLVEQYRHPLAERSWEFPSGSVEERMDADARATAVRELREETGLVAGDVTPLAVVAVAPSMSGQRCTVFLATALSSGAPKPDPEEGDLRSAWFARAEVERMIADGVVADAKSLAAYAQLLVHERR
jgi:8-oxo-dGTP pyrophosphatase MutT (NUDIX family)